MRQIIVIVITGIFVGGCSTNPKDCNPNEEGGFISGATGVLSGCYEERTKAAAAASAAENQKTDQLRQTNDSMRKEAAQKKERLDAIRRRQAEIEGEIPLLKKRLAEEAETNELEEQIARYKEELKRLEAIESSLLDLE